MPRRDGSPDGKYRTVLLSSFSLKVKLILISNLYMEFQREASRIFTFFVYVALQHTAERWSNFVKRPVSDPTTQKKEKIKKNKTKNTLSVDIWYHHDFTVLHYFISHSCWTLHVELLRQG